MTGPATAFHAVEGVVQTHAKHLPMVGKARFEVSGQRECVCEREREMLDHIIAA